MADGRSGIVPLNTTNFPTWKIQCRMALLKLGVWGIVDGTEVAPEEDDHANYRKFRDRRDKALSTIVLAVDVTLLYLIPDPQDPQEVWEKLCNQFQKKTWANKLTLRRRLYSLRLKDNESVQHHIKQMSEIFEELAVIGQPIEDEDRVVHLLSSLPDSFNMLVTAFEASPEVPSIEVVSERLLHEERKRKEKSERNVLLEDNHDALFVGSSGKSKFRGPICFYCGRNGHIKRNCEEWNKRLEENSSGPSEDKKQPEIANFSHVRNKKKADNRWSDSDDDDVIDCIALVSEVLPRRNRNKWIVDSAASNHMCCEASRFSSMRKLEKVKKIKVGNGKYLKASKTGTVKLLIKTGNKVRKCKLNNVLFVPDLKFNLLSVSKSAEAGKRTEFDTRGCKFIDVMTNETVGTASKLGDLYYVNCESIERESNRNHIHANQMETALISVKESNFQNEMMGRLKLVKENKKSITTDH